MRAPGWKSLLLALGLAVFAAAHALGPDTNTAEAPATTREHLKQSAWWPTRQLADSSQVVGEATCAGCHAGIAHTQASSQMARTMMAAAESQFLTAHSENIFKYGSYRYTLSHTKGVVLTVSDGAQATTAPLQWAFGSGEIAQGYVWWIKDQLYESRFNYYGSMHGFDQTPGRLADAPVSLDNAMGRKVAGFEARTCYACHASALTATEPLTAAHFQPGITCEGCHGPGRAHSEAQKAGNWDDVNVVNPAHLSPAASVDFCGACHGTPKDVALMGFVGTLTVRFPAYRLEKSRCWGISGDARLACFACHNPHQPLEKDAAAYDAACFRCHAGGPATTTMAASAKQPACPVAKDRCTSCHMPKVTLSGMHYAFSDHDIRIVKSGAGFPD
jgi:hypothetical protein